VVLATEERAAEQAAGPRVLARAVVAVGVLVSLLLVWAGSEVVRYAVRDDRAPADAILVLGTSAWNGEPGPVLEARLEHALDLYQDGIAPAVVTVGGIGAGDTVSEADAGERWLRRAGVPADAVVPVPVGVDTLTSLEAVAPLARERGWESFVVVSDPSHQARVRHMALGLGLQTVGSPTQDGRGSTLTPRSVVRETLGLVQWVLIERHGVEPAADP